MRLDVKGYPRSGSINIPGGGGKATPLHPLILHPHRLHEIGRWENQQQKADGRAVGGKNRRAFWWGTEKDKLSKKPPVMKSVISNKGLK